MEQMIKKVKELPGFLGSERGVEQHHQYHKIGIVYWKDIASLNAWRYNAAHLKAKEKGIAHFYHEYTIRVCHVLEHYGANLTPTDPQQLAYESRESLID